MIDDNILEMLSINPSFGTIHYDNDDNDDFLSLPTLHYVYDEVILTSIFIYKFNLI